MTWSDDDADEAIGQRGEIVKAPREDAIRPSYLILANDPLALLYDDTLCSVLTIPFGLGRIEEMVALHRRIASHAADFRAAGGILTSLPWTDAMAATPSVARLSAWVRSAAWRHPACSLANVATTVRRLRRSPRLTSPDLCLEAADLADLPRAASLLRDLASSVTAVASAPLSKPRRTASVRQAAVWWGGPGN